jgi:biopolymer transport protein ExbD
MTTFSGSGKPISLRPAGRRRRSPISLTPLIDVVFILLVFFMLASSFMDWRAVDLDAPGKAAAGSAMEGAMLVELRADGMLLAGRRVELPDLVARVTAKVREKPEQRIILRPASGVVLQQAVTVLDALSAAGARNLTLVRRPRD